MSWGLTATADEKAVKPVVSAYGARMVREREELEKTAALLAQTNNMRIRIDPTSKVGSYEQGKDGAEDTLTIGTLEMYKRSADYYVGLILHEIGHARHSDFAVLKKAPEPLHGSVNMLEDERIEELLRLEHEGAAYYLSEVHTPHVDEIETMLGAVPDMIGNSIVEADSNKQRASFERLHEELREAGAEGITSEMVHARVAEIAKEARERLRALTIGLAYVVLDERSTVGLTTGVKECDMIADEVARIMRRARAASKEEIVPLAKKAEEILSQIAPPPEPPEAPAGMRQAVQQKGGGHKPTESRRHKDPKYAEPFDKMDEKARGAARAYSRKLMARIRENERSKSEGGKRRGHLDKKRIARGALPPPYRIFSKRILPKGKRYAVAVVLDTSGSMFDGGMRPMDDRIVNGWYGTTLVARTFRVMGYPSSITLYGAEASLLLDHRETYVHDRLLEKVKSYSGDVYCSGENNTYRGIKEALPRLIASGTGREKILLIITDGGLEDYDIEKSRKAIRQAEKAGVHTIIMYVEDRTRRILDIMYVEDRTRRILDDERREITIEDAREIPEACMKLIRAVSVSEVD